MSAYATLAQCRFELDVQQQVAGSASQTINDNKVLQALGFITERITTMVGGYEFLPRRTTVYFDAMGHQVDVYDGTLELSNAKGLHPALNITTLVDGQGNTLVEGTDYYAYPRGETPILSLRTLQSSAAGWSQFNTGWQDAIAITGVYGWRKRYSTDAWVSSLDTVENASGLNATETSILVNDVDGAGASGVTPRFSAGNLIQIESEWMSIASTDIAANTMTVTRGERGSTAASHAKESTISVFSVQPEIVRACVRWAAYLYARIGSFEVTTYDGLGAATTFPPDAPQEVFNILKPYTDIRWAGV